MDNFTFYAPTYFVFGKDGEKQVGHYVKRFKGSRVLLHYGSQSAIKSGLLARVEESLKQEQIDYIKLGGVRPNPTDDLVYAGIKLCRAEHIDFVLAVGGGSVI
ncbi:MAG: iron-containing alcohol dehydrogenase, partial [Succinivibrio sp.]|nr:iron-containing alcohol dehydrogenase [Succinivibrio sp.]